MQEILADEAKVKKQIQELDKLMETALGEEAFSLECQHRACWKKLECLSFEKMDVLDEDARIDALYAESEGESLSGIPEGYEEL